MNHQKSTHFTNKEHPKISLEFNEDDILTKELINIYLNGKAHLYSNILDEFGGVEHKKEKNTLKKSPPKLEFQPFRDIEQNECTVLDSPSYSPLESPSNSPLYQKKRVEVANRSADYCEYGFTSQEITDNKSILAFI